MRSINWPARFDACTSNCSIHVLVCVCRKWLEFCLEFNFAVRHIESCYVKPLHHNDLIYVRYYHWCFCQQFNCSSMTIVSSSQASRRTCNDYSGSSGRSFSSRWARNSIAINSNCESSSWLHSYMRVRFYCSNQHKMQKWAESYGCCHAAVTSIWYADIDHHKWMQILWSSQMNNYISRFIKTLNEMLNIDTLSFLYGL